MVKGCQREMILLQTKESPVFECAYFVLRKGRAAMPRGDMVAEANRILGREEQGPSSRPARLGLLLFFVGVAIGAGLFALTCAIIP